MNATRQKKLEFIRSFGPFSLEKAVTEMLRRKEAPWLTDEQVDELTEQMVSDARWTQHHNMRNRNMRNRALVKDIAAASSEPAMFRARQGLDASTGVPV